MKLDFFFFGGGGGGGGILTKNKTDKYIAGLTQE